MLRRTPLLTAPSLCALLAGCDLATLFGGECDTYKSAFEQDLALAGQLEPTITASAEAYPMAMLLNQNAVNELFRRLSDTEIPALTQTFRVLGQPVHLALQPSIPLLQIGGDGRCPDCIAASVPFGVGIGFNANPPPVGTGAIAVQMPIAMLPDDNQRTALTASFQQLDVTGISIDSGNGTADTIVAAAEPVANALLTAWLRSRFENARIATIDSWAIGQGDVLLAGRGPFVNPEAGTIVVAMQSNLKTRAGTFLELDPTLPEGADIGFVFHPELLLAMTRRMNYEGVIPQSYDAAGGEQSGGAIRLSVQSMATGDDELLRTTTRLHAVDTVCGTADLAASFGLVVEPGKFAFAVRDVQFVDGQGIGSLLGQGDWIASTFINSLLTTLDFTVNYDQVFGGEAGEQPEMGTFRASIDSRGIGVYLNVVPGI